MIADVKQYITDGQLDQANKLLMQLIRSDTFQAYIECDIVNDKSFWAHAIRQYTMKIIEDPTKITVPPDLYTSELPADYFVKFINDVSDVRGHLLHVCGHEKCHILWKNCPVMMESFNGAYLDVIEDIYGQALLFVCVPSQYIGVEQRIVNCLTYRGLEVTALRKEINSLLLPNPQTTDKMLSAIHTWLYASDPLSQQTFNTYIGVWAQALKNPEFRAKIDRYATVLEEAFGV